MGISGSRLTYFHDAFGVQDYGLFWKMTSGGFPYSALVGSTVDTCLRQFTEACMVQTAENCGVSAVAVHQGRRLSLRGAQADFPWSLRPWRLPSCASIRWSIPFVAGRAVPCRDTEACRILQFFPDMVFNALLCRACWSSTFCRGAEAGSHGPACALDH